MNSPQKTSVRYQQQRQRAIEAAATVFADKGFHGASTQDIASHLGIQQGSLYYYIDSKEAALEEVCLMALRGYVSQMEHIIGQKLPLEAKLANAIRAHLSSYREHNEAMKVHNEQRLYLPEQRRNQLKVLGSRYRQLLENIFHEAVMNGDLHPDLDCNFSARSLIGLCNYWGVILLRDHQLKLEDISTKCLQQCLYGCTPHRSGQ